MPELDPSRPCEAAAASCFSYHDLDAEDDIKAHVRAESVGDEDLALGHFDDTLKDGLRHSPGPGQRRGNFARVCGRELLAGRMACPHAWSKDAAASVTAGPLMCTAESRYGQWQMQLPAQGSARHMPPATISASSPTSSLRWSLPGTRS